MSEVDEVLERLGHLEKQNRRLKKAFALVVVILGAALVMGQAASKTRIIEAERFVLRDKNGFTRAELTTKPSGDVGLYFYNPNRFKALKETVKAAGGEFKDPPDVTLELSPDGSPRLRLGVIGEPNIDLDVSSTGGGGLGKRSVRIGYSAKGEPAIHIVELDRKEKPLKYKALAGLGILNEGNPGLFVSDKEGNTRAALLTKDDGTPSLTFYDEKGAVQRQETAGAMQKGPMWVLWEQGITLGGIGQAANEFQFRESSVARGAWPSKQECEAHRAQWEQSNQGRKIPAVFTCLPDTVNLRAQR